MSASPHSRNGRNGRAAMLQMLDVLWSDSENIRLLHDALQKDLRDNPLDHFRKYMMPLLPRTATVEIERLDAKEVAEQILAATALTVGDAS